MASLNTQTKYVNIVIRPVGYKISERDNLVRTWCYEFCELFAYIYHKNDINLDGEIEEEHLHIVATLKVARRLSTTLTSLSENIYVKTSAISIEKTNSMDFSIQYLLHKNDRRKTPHDIDEITHNYDINELKTILSATTDNLTAQRLHDIVINAKTNYDIILAVGLNRYHNLRGVIKDMKEDIYQRKKEFHKIANPQS